MPLSPGPSFFRAGRNDEPLLAFRAVYASAEEAGIRQCRSNRHSAHPDLLAGCPPSPMGQEACNGRAGLHQRADLVRHFGPLFSPFSCFDQNLKLANIPPAFETYAVDDGQGA